MSNKKTNFLGITSFFVLTYLTLKVILFPIVQTGINITSHLGSQEKISIDAIKVPDITFSDIMLLLIIFLFQPQASEIFEKLNISPQGISADFRKLEKKVGQNKEEIDKLQKKQIDEINKLQQFMYRLLLTSKEIEKLEGLNENNLTEFYVNKPAADELRRLRDSNLITIDRYVNELERLSNYGEISIDLTQYCAITESGHEFLMNLKNMTNSNKEEKASLETQKMEGS